MAVCKDNSNGYNGYRVCVTYIDWMGVRRRHDKRGFKTRREAVAYEAEFKSKISKDINMGFDSFVDVYLNDKRQFIKVSTMATKVQVINSHIRPYFKRKSLSEITQADILQWRSCLLGIRDENGKQYSKTYLRTIENQLYAIFNHAVLYYGLPKNPCRAVPKRLGKAAADEMEFWTEEEYFKFSRVMRETPMAYYIFQVLYWTGIRSGELLALTRADFNLEKRTLRINKTFQVVHGQELITSPKTEKGNRIIELPQFLCDEMQDYFDSLYRCSDDRRIFPVTKHYLHVAMDRGSKAAGIKRIRVHDLRHSSTALLINMGYSPTQIADRLGHKSSTVTEIYSHLYPSAQKEMAERLNYEFHKRGQSDEE